MYVACAAASSHVSIPVQVCLIVVPDSVLHNTAAAPCLPCDGLLPGGWCGSYLQDSTGLPHTGEGRVVLHGHGGNAQGGNCGAHQ